MCARACVREVSACFRVLAVTHHLAAAAPAAGGVAGDGGGSALVNTFPSFSFSVRFRSDQSVDEVMVRGKSDVVCLPNFNFVEKQE